MQLKGSHIEGIASMEEASMVIFDRRSNFVLLKQTLEEVPSLKVRCEAANFFEEPTTGL